ncbi:MAG: hypothetical protein PWR22_1875 [Moorella sp. (in: firmicutes)]|jgi:uncharacterized ferritin-like protein (DUF455 family)|uniref:Uncharacterized protein n=1 Tax=Neomoorella humiferrea TaxID=676965 RepID=A0A2T0AV73_9FIRM|nr:hypothetical protein [Moorella humiferrea]MDK2817246.1 hypothetical protein [Moorella sp. (in: firmicutes)]MDK2895744.1 hypothetical protein [Moorella sp. (in: firmicutes)]PRR74490.1 hypothetical protein MOHU_08030 [Moorella humiferrea]
MRQKVGTAINPRLLHRAKLVAKNERKHLNDIIEEALEQYLYGKKGTGDGETSIVKTTRGSIPSRLEVVKKILEEEDFFEV